MSKSRGVVRVADRVKSRGGAPSNRDRVMTPARGGAYRRPTEQIEARRRAGEDE